MVLYGEIGGRKCDFVVLNFSRFQFDFKNQAEFRPAKHTSRQSQEMASFWSDFQVIWLLVSGDMGSLRSIIAHSSIKRKQEKVNVLKFLDLRGFDTLRGFDPLQKGQGQGQGQVNVIFVFLKNHRLNNHLYYNKTYIV